MQQPKKKEKKTQKGTFLFQCPMARLTMALRQQYGKICYKILTLLKSLLQHLTIAFYRYCSVSMRLFFLHHTLTVF